MTTKIHMGPQQENTARYSCYVRVSTARQAQSQLGILAQRQRIQDFVGVQGEIVAWYEEHESGAKADRPELEKALTTCELTGSTLLVATLDRLSRDVMFLEKVKIRCAAGGFSFKCVDMPDADSFMLGIMAQVAQYERERISARTKAGLAQAKLRGTKLGNPRGAASFNGQADLGASRAGAVHRTNANQWASKRREIMVELIEAGLSLRAMAKELTTRRIATRRGGQWSACAVARLIRRLEIENFA